MSYSKNQYSAYGMASETVSKTRQVVMLYEGIIKFVMKARSAIEEKRIEDRFNNLQRACKIILGLQAGLDFENGGEIAHILNNFYTTMDLRVLALNQSNSLDECDNIIEDFKKMRDAWEEVNNTTEGGEDIPIPSKESLTGSQETVAVSI